MIDEPHQRAHDRVDHEPRLVGEERESSTTCAAATTTSPPTSRRWLRFEMPLRCGISPATTGSAGGTSTDATTRAVHHTADADGTVHASDAAWPAPAAR